MFNLQGGPLAGLLDTILARKTIHAFAEALNELPSALQPAFEPYLDPGRPALMILQAPSQSVVRRQERAGWRIPWEITPSRVLVLQSDCLLVASSPYQPAGGSTEPVITRIPLEDVVYLESGFVLLTAWLECGWAQDGQLERLRIDYNTVSRGLFESLGAQMRMRMLELGGRDWRTPGVGLAPLTSFPYKFRVLIPYHLLLEGESVCSAVFLAGSRGRRGRLRQVPAAANRAVLRTPAHLILCSEEATPAGDPSGLVGRFLPLNRVQRIEPQEGGWVVCLGRGGASCELQVAEEAGEVLLE